MNTKLYKLSNTIKFFPVELLTKITGKNTIFPFYHIVSNDKVPHVEHLYPIRTTQKFEQDLDFFLNHYTPIEIDDIIDSTLHGKPLKKNSFLLSFDDGLSEVYDIIAPILLRKGIPAIFFINSGFIDNKDLFFRYKASILIEKLKNDNSYNEKQISQWFQSNQFS